MNQKNIFLEMIQNRRTYYGLSKEMPISKEEVIEIVRLATWHTPSAFNSQSAYVAVLFGGESDRLWDMVDARLSQKLTGDSLVAVKEKIAGFRAGCGTILFFEDQDKVKDLQERFPAYKEQFPIWSQQSSGMLQFAIWTALEVAGFGVNLQHYSNLIEEEVKKIWDIPSQYQLIAQMPFGTPTSNPLPKEIQKERVRIIE